MVDDCRPPEGTPDGTVVRLRFGVSDTVVDAIWVSGYYHWPHPSVKGTVAAYTPQDLAAAGWSVIAEPPDA